MSGGVLVGGEPEAILAASVALHEVAFRTDDVGRRLAVALGPAATTVLATVPFAPVQAAAVTGALHAVLASPWAGLGQVGSAYEAASYLLRTAGQALELAGLVTLVGTSGFARLKGQEATVLDRVPAGTEVTREAMSFGASALAAGRTSTVAVRQVERDGTTFYVVELITSPRVAASFGIQVNGTGGYAEAVAGTELTLRWAVATREDAELLVAQATVGLLPGLELVGSLPKPTEVTVGTIASTTLVSSSLPFLPMASGTAVTRAEVTDRLAGGEHLALTISGAGTAGLAGLAGTGGAASLRMGLEREAGAVTKLTLTTATEVDRGRHGLPPLEAVNREATLEEREWELELTPELRARADRVASAVADGRAPDQGDVRALANAAAGVEPKVRAYDVRHQQMSVDVGLPEASAGGSLAVDTARLRTPEPVDRKSSTGHEVPSQGRARPPWSR